MDLATFDQLFTPTGTACLAAAVELAPTFETFLPAFEKLRKHYAHELCKAAVETAILRQKATAKFSRAAEMFFTREALEQATSEPVARYRATRFGRYQTVADLCCGIGADAVAFAEAGCEVIALDHDPLRVRMTERNAAALGVTVRAVVADVLTDPLPATDAVFLDPARRSDGKRFLSLADYLPPPDAVLARLPAGIPAGIKLAPGVPLDEVSRRAGEIEFVSLDRELKECILFVGEFATARRRATVLPAGATVAADHDLPALVPVPPAAYLYDLDPAVTRAALAPPVAAGLSAGSLNVEGTLLTADRLTPTPFAAVYAINDVLPFHAKRVGEHLRANGIGRVTVVQRGSGIDAERVSKTWKLSGDEHRAVVFTRVDGRPTVIIARRVADPTGR